MSVRQPRESSFHLQSYQNLFEIGEEPSQISLHRRAVRMGVAGDLIVHLKRYSKALIEETFMKIEEPEVPLDIPVKPAHAALAASASITIGEVYAGIRAQIVQSGPGATKGEGEIAGRLTHFAAPLILTNRLTY